MSRAIWFLPVRYLTSCASLTCFLCIQIALSARLGSSLITPPTPVLPVDALGTLYLVLTPSPHSYLLLVAHLDNTTVNLTLTLEGEKVITLNTQEYRDGDIVTVDLDFCQTYLVRLFYFDIKSFD